MEINARITEIKIGSSYHDGRGFATIHFVGDGWGQGAPLPMDPGQIDDLIRAAGAPDLLSCIGRYVRIRRVDGLIEQVGHILLEDTWVSLRG